MKKTITGVLVVAAMTMTLAPAGAHTSVAGSNPEEGSKVAAVPETVWVRFGGALGPEQPFTVSEGTIKVTDACGNQIDDGQSFMNDTQDTISVAATGLHRGKHTIKWQVTAIDGAEQAGKITFKVTKGPACSKRG